MPLTVSGGVPSVNDVIVSDGAVIEMDHIRIGGRVARAYFVVEYKVRCLLHGLMRFTKLVM